MTRYNSTTTKEKECIELSADDVIFNLNINIRSGDKVTFWVEQYRGQNKFESTMDMSKRTRINNGIISIERRGAADLYIKPTKGDMFVEKGSKYDQFFFFEGVEMKLTYGREHFWQKKHEYFKETTTKYKVMVKNHDDEYFKR